MASVLGYIRQGSATSGSNPASFWCRPAHKPTCCMAVYCGGSCCICVPTTATCFIIEMWGQGGGGGGGCCCGSGPYGGQGGAYGWVACTTSGTNHILCACNCICICSQCGICSGNPGQFSRVCNCGGPGGFWCVCGGGQGLWCCFFGGSSCCCSGATYGGGGCCMNTWNFFNNCSSTVSSSPTSSSGTCLVNCGCVNAQTTVCTNASLWSGCASQAVGAASVLDVVFCSRCVCTCFSSPYVWLGACGWADPAASVTAFGCLNNQNGPANSQCGGGMGVGGAAYAGGDQQWWNRCGFCCYQCYGAAGHFPGGGGITSGGGTAWVLPGHGASGLILISWC